MDRKSVVPLVSLIAAIVAGAASDEWTKRVFFTSEVYQVPTTERDANVAITRAGPAEECWVSYRTSDGTAHSGTDYMATSGILRWQTGHKEAVNVSIELIHRNATTVVVAIAAAADCASDAPFFFVSLYKPEGGAELGRPAVAKVKLMPSGCTVLTPLLTTDPIAVGGWFTPLLFARNNENRRSRHDDGSDARKFRDSAKDKPDGDGDSALTADQIKKLKEWSEKASAVESGSGAIRSWWDSWSSSISPTTMEAGRSLLRKWGMSKWGLVDDDNELDVTVRAASAPAPVAVNTTAGPVTPPLASNSVNGAHVLPASGGADPPTPTRVPDTALSDEPELAPQTPEVTDVSSEQHNFDGVKDKLKGTYKSAFAMTPTLGFIIFLVGMTAGILCGLIYLMYSYGCCTQFYSVDCTETCRKSCSCCYRLLGSSNASKNSSFESTSGSQTDEFRVINSSNHNNNHNSDNTSMNNNSGETNTHQRILEQQNFTHNSDKNHTGSAAATNLGPTLTQRRSPLPPVKATVSPPQPNPVVSVLDYSNRRFLPFISVSGNSKPGVVLQTFDSSPHEMKAFDTPIPSRLVRVPEVGHQFQPDSGGNEVAMSVRPSPTYNRGATGAAPPPAPSPLGMLHFDTGATRAVSLPRPTAPPITPASVVTS